MPIEAEQKHVVIVGAGPGGLTAAMILAYRGFKVTVVEARATVGGRNAAIRLGPYTFDTGPTFLMLRDILDQVFQEAGARTDDLLTMKALDPMYRLCFDDCSLEPSTNRARMRAEIARAFPGRESCYERFFERERRRFAALYPCLQRPYSHVRDLISAPLFKAIPHLALGQSLFSVMQQCFGDEKLALSFTFQSKYLGMSPWECPGLFSIIPYIEHAYGIEHPIGGLSRISEAMAGTAQRHGAIVRLSSPVERILVRNRIAVGVRLAGGEEIHADDVIVNADFGYAMTSLFEPGLLRKYTPNKLSRMRFSCSTFMLYLGLDRTLDLPHHTIVFAKDYRKNVERIFQGLDPCDDLSLYVRNASAGDPTLAPSGHSALYILIPVPNLRGRIDWPKQREVFRERALAVLEQRTTAGNVRPHIREELLLSPEDWRDTYRVYEGATFNLAHNWTQLIHLRPHNRFEELDHCYLVGGGTHPGSGLPTIYESGRIAANMICRSYAIPFTSGNLEA